MKHNTFSILLAALLPGFISAAGAQSFVTNGSLEDLNAGGGYPRLSGIGPERWGDVWRVPPGWSQLVAPLAVGSSSSDLLTAQGMWNGTSQEYGPLTPSPDGGVFVGSANDSTFREGLRQTITGLETGETYKLTFYSVHADNGVYEPSYQLPSGLGYWSVYFGSDLVFSGSTLSPTTDGTNVWVSDSYQFTATQSDFELAFAATAVNSARTYLGIDGIFITAVAAVPEPSGVVLMGLAGSLGLARRRRSA